MKPYPSEQSPSKREITMFVTKQCMISNCRFIKMIGNITGRFFLLMLLSLDIACCTLLQRYTQIVEGSNYLASIAVFLAEAQKLVISLFVSLFWEHAGSIGSFKAVVTHELAKNKYETLLMSVPSVVYAVQNNLGYLALDNLDPATYQVTLQFKIVSTAIFMVIIMKTELGMRKWIAVLLLTIGVALVSLDNIKKVAVKDVNYPIGLLSVLAYCLCSGFASVFFEKLIKPNSGAEVSLWVKNIQIYFFGVIVTGGIAIGQDWEKIRDPERGPFVGFNILVHCVVVLHSLGGIVISLVMKYSDNIVRNFCNAVAIILASIGAVVIFKTQLGLFWLVGLVIVVGSGILYKMD